MTSTVSLDESGNVGSQDRYFVLAALIAKRTNDLNKSFKILDEMRKKRSSAKGSDHEVKFRNSYPDERIRVLQSLSESSVSIVYVAIDKKKSKLYSNTHNCDLYKAAIKEILPLIGKALTTNDVVLNFDENLCISMKDLIDTVNKNLQKRNVKSVKKVRSFADKAVQLADFISGSVREKYENGDEQYITVIEEKISIAHET
jgi:hypothetical protein